MVPSTKPSPEKRDLASMEAAVQGTLQILDSACQAKTVSEAGQTGGFSQGFLMGF